MKITARAFVVDRYWSSSMSLNDYRLALVMENGAVEAAVSGDVPLRAFRGSAVDLALDRAMRKRTLVHVIVDVPDEESDL